MSEKRLRKALEEIKAPDDLEERVSHEMATSDSTELKEPVKSYEPLSGQSSFVEHEPLSSQYDMVGSEFIQIGPREYWKDILGEVPGSVHYDSKFQALKEELTLKVEEEFKQKAINIARHPYQSHLVAGFRDSSGSDLVNMANIWRTDFIVTSVSPKTPIPYSKVIKYTHTTLRISVSTQGEVFFFRRIKHGQENSQ